ncbi:hypothetical protein PFISCL1PPCAC_13369 [Pristionchus fissidentatus]|uniref:C2H2-type domain-containing protein n=1 Tax=Pristionchus fissidentatus TaxID=1538716 RepID=A0AAV5VQW1_9BILA|nr:hypothetical protein PFISCL1PPCAC_13369 [Pristionchus fissidentatus]
MEDAKRCRLWNPAVEENLGKESSLDAEPLQQNTLDPRTTAFALAAFAQQQFMQQQLHHLQHVQQPANPLPFLLQPYLSMALPLLTAQQNIAAQALPQKRKEAARVKSVSPTYSLACSSPPSSVPSSSSSSSLTPSFNPIVKSALGIHVPDENCCAVCGASFRLTTDLVTHMRNNHRRNKFKRKSDE